MPLKRRVVKNFEYRVCYVLKLVRDLACFDLRRVGLKAFSHKGFDGFQRLLFYVIRLFFSPMERNEFQCEPANIRNSGDGLLYVKTNRPNPHPATHFNIALQIIDGLICMRSNLLPRRRSLCLDYSKIQRCA